MKTLAISVITKNIKTKRLFVFMFLLIYSMNLYSFAIKISAIDGSSGLPLNKFFVYCDNKYLSFSDTLDYSEGNIECSRHIYTFNVNKMGYLSYTFELDFSSTTCHDTSIVIFLERIITPEFFPIFHFDNNTDKIIDNDYFSKLQNFKNIYHDNLGVYYLICGYADSSEIKNGDTTLAYNRANYVYQELIRIGVDGKYFMCRGIENEPFTINYSEYINEYFKFGDSLTEHYINLLPTDIQDKARNLNRRVEIILINSR